jgi:hypothetical protein
LQLKVPWEFEHELPHDKQFDSVPSGVSQPFVALVSQLAKPVEQIPRVHVPVVHDSEAFARLHVTSQSPQLVSERMLRSQPFALFPSQLFQPASQTGWQPVMALQVVMPWAFVHASPHDRQFVGVPSCVSQPACALVQSRNPLLQVVSVHVPVAQDSLAFARLQGTPQPPQLVRVFSGVSHPLPGASSQSSQPLSQVVTWQLPVAQLGVPCAVLHERPHMPQFVSVLSCVSQPLLRLPSQSPQPIWQLGTQPFDSQLVVP